MLKPVFDGKFSSPTFWGSFFSIFAILGVLTLNLAFFTPKRHFLIRKDIYRCISWNSPISGVGCTLVQEPPQKKCHHDDIYVGHLSESDPLCKCYETWHGGSCQVRNHSDRFWSTPANRFRCVATPKLSPCHRQGPWGLLQLFPLPWECVIPWLVLLAKWKKQIIQITPRTVLQLAILKQYTMASAWFDDRMTQTY